VFIHWLYPDARIDWASMNKHESDKILEQLRQRGEYIHPLSKAEILQPLLGWQSGSVLSLAMPPKESPQLPEIGCLPE